MLEIQKFLLERPIEELEMPPYCLKIRHYPEDDIYIFNYSQTESDPYNPIVKEARGLALCRSANWRVVRYGFNRFMNIGEDSADNIEWSSATASQKEDGTLLLVCCWNGKYHIGTRSCLDAFEAPLNSLKFKNFGELFWIAYKNTCGNDPLWWHFAPEYTTCLELCAPDNKVVLDYDEPKLFYLMSRNNLTFEEFNLNIGIPKPAEYRLDSKEAYELLVKSFGEDKEGIVVKDKFCHRVKIKTESYFRLHKMIQNHILKDEDIVKMIMTGEDKEFLCYFTEYKPRFDHIRNIIWGAEEFCGHICMLVFQWKIEHPNSPRKDFALWVKGCGEKRFSMIYFKAYDGRMPKQIFYNFTYKQIVELFIKES